MTFPGQFFSLAHCILHSSLISYKWRSQKLALLDQDEENNIYIEGETPDNFQNAKNLQDMISYTPRDVCEFLFGDADGNFSDQISQDDKLHLFEVYIKPMIISYQEIKNKYEQLFQELQSDILPQRKLRATLPDLDFMGRVWTENLEKKTFHEPFLCKEEVKKAPEDPKLSSPETFIEDEEDDFDDIDEFKEHSKTPIKSL